MSLARPLHKVLVLFFVSLLGTFIHVHISVISSSLDALDGLSDSLLGHLSLAVCTLGSLPLNKLERADRLSLFVELDIQRRRVHEVFVGVEFEKHESNHGPVKVKEGQKDPEVDIVGDVLLELETFKPSHPDGLTTLTRNLTFVIDTLDTEEHLSKRVSPNSPELPFRNETAALGNDLRWNEGLSRDRVGGKGGEKVDKVEGILEILKGKSERGVSKRRD